MLCTPPRMNPRAPLVELAQCENVSSQKGLGSDVIQLLNLSLMRPLKCHYFCFLKLGVQ